MPVSFGFLVCEQGAAVSTSVMVHVGCLAKCLVRVKDCAARL